MIYFICPSCQHIMQATDEQAGQHAPCERCSTAIEIPPAPVIEADHAAFRVFNSGEARESDQYHREEERSRNWQRITTLLVIGGGVMAGATMETVTTQGKDSLPMALGAAMFGVTGGIIVGLLVALDHEMMRLSDAVRFVVVCALATVFMIAFSTIGIRAVTTPAHSGLSPIFGATIGAFAGCGLLAGLHTLRR